MTRILLNTIALDPLRWSWPRQNFFRLADLLPGIAHSGFRGIELWQYHLHSNDIAATKSLLDQYAIDVEVVSLYPILAGDEAAASLGEMRDVIAAAAGLGAKSVKIFVGNLASAEVADDHWAQSLENLDALIAAAADGGLALNGETHENTLFDDIIAVEHVLTAIGKGRMGVCFQPYDFTDSDGTIETLRKLAPDIRHVHFQGRGADGTFIELHKAPIDYRRMLGILARAGFDGPLSIEFVKDCVVSDPKDFDLERVLANAVADREYLERIGREAGLRL